MPESWWQLKPGWRTNLAFLVGLGAVGRVVIFPDTEYSPYAWPVIVFLLGVYPTQIVDKLRVNVEQAEDDE